MTSVDRIAAAARSLVGYSTRGKRTHEYLDGLPDENAPTGYKTAGTPKHLRPAASDRRGWKERAAKCRQN